MISRTSASGRRICQSCRGGASFAPGSPQLMLGGMRAADLPCEQEWIHEKYMDELLSGVVRPETRAGLLAIVEQLRERDGIDGLLLAGTELSLIIRQDAHHGIPFLDTARIHVEKAIDELLRH